MENLSYFEARVVGYEEDDFVKFLKDNNVVMDIIGKEWGYTLARLTGTYENLKTILDDYDYGWGGDYTEDWIKSK